MSWVGYILINIRPYLSSDQFLSAMVRCFPHRVTWQFIFPIVRLALQSLMRLCITRRTETPIKNKTHRLEVYILNYMLMLAVGTTIMRRSRDACVRGHWQALEQSHTHAHKLVTEVRSHIEPSINTKEENVIYKLANSSERKSGI